MDGSLHVGSEVAPLRARLAGAGAHNEVSVSSGRVRDGVGAAAVLDYLDVMTTPRGPNLGLRTFRTPPTVSVPVGTDERFKDYAVRAVQIVNAALPYDKRLRFRITPAPDPVTYSDVPDGNIVIEFIPQAQWPYEALATAAGHAVQTVTRSRSGSRTVKAHALIDIEQLASRPLATLYTVLHELLHAVGFTRHVDPARFPGTILGSHQPRNFTRIRLGKSDGEALLAAHSRLEPGALQQSISTALGPWTDTSFHLRGDLPITGGGVSFGVAHRNGLSQPWASGPTPWVNLVNNQELSGSVRWAGRLLGFTPETEAVAGAADLTVNLKTLSGQIDFTDMEQWSVSSPGAIGTGTRWGDGDLRYSVAVRGNTFVQTGGDAGEVTGAFFGPKHEGMGGVLERRDLSAGFGGKR